MGHGVPAGRPPSTRRPGCSCTTAASTPPAAPPTAPSGRSTARSTRPSTSASTSCQGLDQNLGAPGDFAKAYVVAHEVGHHVQNLLGITDSVDQRDSSSSVAVELQADCLAGVWGNSANKRGLIENGDLDEGLNAAASVGDDVLMRQAGQTVNPDSFTHGSAEERASWLLRGYNTGNADSCDTFSAAA